MAIHKDIVDMVKAITTNHMATCKAIPHICRTTAVAMDNVSAVLCLVIIVAVF